MSDIAWALAEFDPNSKRMLRYRDLRAYYLGVHPLVFAGDKYKSKFAEMFRNFADNLCASVVDIQAERLEIVGFTTTEAQAGQLDVPGAPAISTVNDPLAERLWEFWEMSDMDLASDKVHRDAFLYGDGFLMLEPLEGGNLVAVWPQEPIEIAVAYSTDKPGQMLRAAKFWTQEDGAVRLNLYYPERIERYFTPQVPSEGTTLKETLFEPVSDEVEPNPFGFIPVFHFANNAYGSYGMSDLRDVRPLQDALNKAGCDLLTAMEFQAFRQRWITGVEIELNDDGTPKNLPWKHGAGEILVFGDDEVKIGDFEQTDLMPFLNVQAALRSEIARVSGIPLHYFFVASAGETPSGEALKTAELRFSRKTKNRQKFFGRTWESVMHAMLVMLEGETSPELDINAVWSAESPRSESEEMDVLMKKQALGVPNSQLQKEAGYDHQQIVQFAAEVAPAQDEPPPDDKPAEDEPVPLASV